MEVWSGLIDLILKPLNHLSDKQPKIKKDSKPVHFSIPFLNFLILNTSFTLSIDQKLHQWMQLHFLINGV